MRTHNHSHDTCCQTGQQTNCCTTAQQKSDHHYSERGGHHHAAGENHDTEQDHDESLPVTDNSARRFSWKIEGMDCPSCAKKIEKAVLTIPTVAHAKVLFATEKLIVSAEANVTHSVLDMVKKLGFTLLPLSTHTAPQSDNKSILQENSDLLTMALLMLISLGVTYFHPTAGLLAFTATTCWGLIPIVKKAVQLIRSGTPFAIETLMSVAAIGALFIGATEEAAMVLLLFMIGEKLESYAANRARKGVSALMALLPDKTVVIRNGERVTVPANKLQPGEIIEIAPGARLPADAELVSDFASFDESALTGESVPVEHLSGGKILAGCLAVDRVSQLRVISKPGNNAIDRILQLIEEAEERRAPIERFIDRFSRYYTPAIMLVALLTVLLPPLLFAGSWETWIYRGLTLLLIGCPCALVISTPAAITSGLAAATRNGALIKGGAALEQLGTIEQVAFDKTGTLTEGKPTVTDVVPIEGVTEQQLLAWGAAVEMGSHHPLALAVIQRAQQASIAIVEAEQRHTLPGVGIQGNVDNVLVLLCSPGQCDPLLLNKEWQARVLSLEEEGKTVVIVIRQQQLVGLFALRDTVRQESKEAVEMLHRLGIRSIMLTGDNPRAAATIAKELQIEYRAGLLPEDKVVAVTELAQQGAIAMVGDGINDAPAMKAANIGVAMGSGTDVALETADAALTRNSLLALAKIIQLSQATHTNIRQNITIALGLKAVFLVTSMLGLTGLWLAVLADSGATALVTANALRLLRKR